MLLKAEAFYSLQRLPESSFYSFYSKNLQDSSVSPTQGFPNQKDNSTTRNLQFIHSCMQYTSMYLQDLPKVFQHSSIPAFQTFQGSTLIQHSSIRMHILHIGWFPENSTEYQLRKLQTSNILQTFILQRKGDVALLVVSVI